MQRVLASEGLPALIDCSCMRTIGIAVLVCTWLGNAVAGPSDADQANALFLEGRELLTSHNTKAACEKFEASIALDPEAPGVMLNLGLCYELLEKYATSLYWFRKAQSAAAEAKLPAYEDEAKRHTIGLAAKVPILRLDASAAAGAEIRIDGKLITPTDYARVEIDRGSHSLEARAAGKQPFRRSFDVEATDAGTISIPALVDEPIKITPTPGDPIIDTPPSRNRVVLAASLGAGGLALCIISPLWARRTKNAYDEAVANHEMPSYSSARTKQHIATGMFVGGLGLIGAGAYLYFVRPARTPTTAITPVIDAQQIGLAISGSL
jgi:tetratricopeptide (TPR) repeat protein